MTDSGAPVPALVLAGGMASRMGGGDKALLELGGRPILSWILDGLEGPVALSANGDASRFATFGLPVLADAAGHAGQGPLAGLCAGLGWAAGLGAEWLLSVPGDTPFLPHGLAGRMMPGPSVAVSGGRRHPLVAVWPVAARARLEALLAAPGSRAVGAFAAGLDMRPVEFLATGEDAFLNVNTPDDLAAARVRIG